MSKDTRVSVIRKHLKTESILATFAEILGGEMDAYSLIADVMLVVRNDERIAACTPESIYKSALRSASLRLSVDESLGLAYLVAYRDVCTFQPSYKGIYDLAMRTNRYTFLNTSPVYEGLEWIPDPLTGLHKLGGEGKKSDKVVGWFGYFQLTSGFQKTMYMTIEEIHAHGKKYSPSYQKNNPESIWIKHPKIAEHKTILKQLLTKWGVFNKDHKKVLVEIDGEQGEVVEGEYAESEPTVVHIIQDGIEVDTETGEVTEAEKEKKPTKKPTKKNDGAPKPWDKRHIDRILEITSLITEEAAIELLDKSGMSKKASVAAIGKWGGSYAAAIVKGYDIPAAIAHAKKYWQDFGEVNKNETASEDN